MFSTCHKPLRVKMGRTRDHPLKQFLTSLLNGRFFVYVGMEEKRWMVPYFVAKSMLWAHIQCTERVLFHPKAPQPNLNARMAASTCVSWFSTYNDLWRNNPCIYCEHISVETRFQDLGRLLVENCFHESTFRPKSCVTKSEGLFGQKLLLEFRSAIHLDACPRFSFLFIPNHSLVHQMLHPMPS